LIGVWNGVPGGHRVLVPLQGVEPAEDTLRVPWPKDQVLDAPRYDEEDESGALLEHERQIQISADKERDVFGHFGLTPSGGDEGRRMRRMAADRSSMPPSTA
jgi:hypothetical protein